MNQWTKRIGRCLLGCLLVLFMGTMEITMAQDSEEPTTEPTNPALMPLEEELARLDLEKKIAERKKEIAEAEQATREAKLPETDTEGLEGTVTLQDGAGYYSEILAYRTLSKTSDNLADKVRKSLENETVVLTDEFDLSQNAALWEIIHGKLKDFEQRFDALLKQYPLRDDGTIDMTKPETLLAAATVIPAFLGAAADIAAFFKVNREIKARTVSLSNRALLSEVAHAILPQEGQNGATILIPSLRIGGKGKLTAKLEDLRGKRREAAARREKIRDQLDLDPVRLEKLTKKLASKEAEKAKLEGTGDDPAKVAALEQEIQQLTEERLPLSRRAARWKEITEQFDPLIQAFDALDSTLTTRPSGEGQAPLEAVATIDVIKGQTPAPWLLYLEVVSQGAEIEITKSMWSSGRISYIGGSVVAYFLLDGDGKLISSGALPRHLASSFKGRRGAQTLSMD